MLLLLIVGDLSTPSLALLQPFSDREAIIRECFQLVSKRSETVCNFLEGVNTKYVSKAFGPDTRLIYRHYATIFFIFAVDKQESELGMLDLIQVFVEALDKCFQNVCELDLIFHSDKVHFILDEIVMGGMVLETSLKEIIKAINGTINYERASKDKAHKQSKKTVIKIGRK